MASIRTRQGLLPGIPDDLTMQCIAPKLNWETCNVLQVVSRGWQRVICNRSVYSAKMHCKSTEPYLVLLWRNRQGTVSLVLFSCKAESPLQLPQITTACPCWFDCICLDGRVYVWVRTHVRTSYFADAGEKCVWVLDLAGDRKWTRRDEGKYSIYERQSFKYGILDERIYRFRGSSHSLRGVLDGGPFGRGSDQRATDHPHFRLPPQTEVYDPLSHVWCLVTPKTSPKVGLDYPDFDGQVASISKWAREEFGEDSSKTYLTYGRYESYFSEWKRRQVLDCSTSSAINRGCQDAMASQVYYTSKFDEAYHDESRFEVVSFFCGGKLLKCRFNNSYHRRQVDHSIKQMYMYNVNKTAWEPWKSFFASFEGLDDDCLSRHFASADNVIWAIMQVTDKHTLYKWKCSLVRTPPLLDGDNDERVVWIDTGFSVDDSWPNSVKLRPIYV